jgi:hypothetical protein
MQLGAIEPNQSTSRTSARGLGITADDIKIEHTAMAARLDKLESDIRMYKMLILAAVVIYFLTKQK